MRARRPPSAVECSSRAGSRSVASCPSARKATTNSSRRRPQDRFHHRFAPHPSLPGGRRQESGAEKGSREGEREGKSLVSSEKLAQPLPKAATRSATPFQFIILKRNKWSPPPSGPMGRLFQLARLSASAPARLQPRAPHPALGALVMAQIQRLAPAPPTPTTTTMRQWGQSRLGNNCYSLPAQWRPPPRQPAVGR